MDYNVIVVGAGASGVCSAIAAADREAKVLIIDKRQQIMKKLQMTGNGRCNFTNKDQALRHYHSHRPDIMEVMLSKISYDGMMDFFEKLGLRFFDKNGYVYPMSNQAGAVCRLLKQAAELRGVSFLADAEVTDISVNDGFTVTAGGKRYSCDKLIISTGSPAGFKSDDPGIMDVIAGLGIKVLPFEPVLTYIKSGAKLTSYWDGVRCRGTIYLFKNGKEICSEAGELMLTDKGVSGIAAFNISSHIDGEGYSLKLDLVPDMDAGQVAEFIMTTKGGVNGCANLYAILPVRLADTVFTEFLKKDETYKNRKSHDVNIGELSETDIRRLAKLIKGLGIPVTGKGPVESSQACSGGVELSELDASTMMSKRYPGLFFTGEAVDVNGDCGGYNLTWAWKSGMMAGSAI